MDREKAIRILAEFFRDSFAEDPAGVSDWVAQSGDDIDEFIALMDREWPPESSS